MDEWGWEQLRPWIVARAQMPIGALFCFAWLEDPAGSRIQLWEPNAAAVARDPGPRG